MPRDFRHANRLEFAEKAGIHRLFSLGQDLPSCVDLSLGEADFKTPKWIVNAIWKAASEGRTHYEPTNGIPELRYALADKAQRDYGVKYDPECEILVTAGATPAIFSSLFALVNPGDEVLVPDPGFVLYAPCVRLAGGVPIPFRDGSDLRSSVQDVTSLVTERSRVIVLNYPNNPTGAVISYDVAVALSKIAVERDLAVISDEVYEKIVYDGAKHYCLASFPGMRERTLVVNSFSKTYAMTGLRLGYIYGPKELVANVWLLHQYTTTCVNSVVQYAGVAALEHSQRFVESMVRELDKRRCLIVERLNEIEGFKCMKPKGAFYVFPNIADFGMSSEDFSVFLAKQAGVITVPGSSFGGYGEGHLRISYSASYEKLEQGLERIETAVKKSD